MSGFKDIYKNGWHPKGKEGQKESWRGDFKGINQVAGWMGKGKDPKAADSSKGEHVSRPLSTLKDPASFGPPPKNVNYHGGAALPNKVTPDAQGLGKPLSRNEVQAAQEAEQEAWRQEQEVEPTRPTPPVPYRADTSGLATSHLPPPPSRRDGADGRGPIGQTAAKPKPPGLPPRLPPRQNSSNLSSPQAEMEPPAYRGILNQGSVDRLGAAGVSVPGLGIGSPVEAASPALSSRSPTTSPVQAANAAQLNELQSRFSRMSTSAGNIDSSDHAGQQGGAGYDAGGQGGYSGTGLNSPKKKPPPPPPKKRADLVGSSVGPPPPVPLNTRPNYS